MNYQSLKTLIDSLAEFEEETGRQGDLPAFSLWLYEKIYPHQSSVVAKEGGNYQPSYDELISTGIASLWQHARHYIKTALRDSPLKGINDFIFLLILREFGDMRKSDLINRTLLEFSPGMEVIRRLLRRDLIEDYDDPDDGRSRRVKITNKGMNALEVAMPKIKEVNRLVAGKLDHEEKITLLRTIQKLQHFHDPIWREHHGEEVDRIIERYLPELAVQN